MANPQTENGHTKIANDLLEKIISSGLNGTEFAVILLVIRKTYGWQKQEDEISLSQFMKSIPVSKITVCNALKTLKLVKILLLVKKGNSSKCSNLYRLNKNYDDWQLVKKTRLVKKTIQTSKENFNKLVKKTLHTKESKETTKEIGSQKALKYFGDKFKNKVGEIYMANFKKDIPLLKTILKLYGKDKTKLLIDTFFNSEDKFITDSGFTVGVFHSQINKLLKGGANDFDHKIFRDQ